MGTSCGMCWRRLKSLAGCFPERLPSSLKESFPALARLPIPSSRCTVCGELHEGIPALHADRPANYWDVPEQHRANDEFLTSDSCVIADRFFFVHGCLEIPVHGYDDGFVWGVWVSLKEENFFLWQEHYDVELRSHLGPFFGWLCTRLPGYPDTMHLKTMVHLRDYYHV